MQDGRRWGIVNKITINLLKTLIQLNQSNWKAAQYVGCSSMGLLGPSVFFACICTYCRVREGIGKEHQQMASAYFVNAVKYVNYERKINYHDNQYKYMIKQCLFE